jgi:hypothetical protein
MRALILVFGGRSRCIRSSWGWVLSWKTPFCPKAVNTKEMMAETLGGFSGRCGERERERERDQKDHEQNGLYFVFVFSNILLPQPTKI